MGKIPSLSGREVIKILEKIGYKPMRQKGSHVILKNEMNNLIVVPVHTNEKIGPGLLVKIINQTGMSKEDFFSFIN